MVSLCILHTAPCCRGGLPGGFEVLRELQPEVRRDRLCAPLPQMDIRTDKLEQNIAFCGSPCPLAFYLPEGRWCECRRCITVSKSSETKIAVIVSMCDPASRIASAIGLSAFGSRHAVEGWPRPCHHLNGVARNHMRLAVVGVWTVSTSYH